MLGTRILQADSLGFGSGRTHKTGATKLCSEQNASFGRQYFCYNKIQRMTLPSDLVRIVANYLDWPQAQTFCGRYCGNNFWHQRAVDRGLYWTNFYDDTESFYNYLAARSRQLQYVGFDHLPPPDQYELGVIQELLKQKLRQRYRFQVLSFYGTGRDIADGLLTLYFEKVPRQMLSQVPVNERFVFQGNTFIKRDQQPQPYDVILSPTAPLIGFVQDNSIGWQRIFHRLSGEIALPNAMEHFIHDAGLTWRSVKELYGFRFNVRYRKMVASELIPVYNWNQLMGRTQQLPNQFKTVIPADWLNERQHDTI